MVIPERECSARRLWAPQLPVELGGGGFSGTPNRPRELMRKGPLEAATKK